MQITSRDNSLLRQVRAVRDGKIEELIFVEGLRLCEEAHRSDLTIEAVVVSEELLRKERAAAAIAELSRVSKRVAWVSEKLLESVSYTKTPQGIIVLAQRPAASEERLAARPGSDPLIVVLHQINNPVNVGAIVRTAEAAGATGAIATKNASDPFSPKALRGAMGSAFRLPIWSGVEFGQMIEWCRERSIITVCADVGAKTSYTELDWTGATALVLGPESSGFTDEELENADKRVSIPMQGAAESLNVSVAAGIMLFEAARQRAS